jgi:hypothetical protein
VPPACGRERWYAVPKGGKRFEERGLRFLGGDGGILLSAVGCPLSAGGSQTVRLQTGMVLGNVSSHIRLVTWRREISRLHFAALEMTLGTRREEEI